MLGGVPDVLLGPLPGFTPGELTFIASGLSLASHLLALS